ncbi:MAG: winged helix-turn-helix domain-containing protein [Planctomycetota bacterium]
MSPSHTNPEPEHTSWTFLTNHSHVLICLYREPNLRVRDVAERVGITQRAVQRIIVDLVDAGILVRHREGRRNVYEVNATIPLRHPVEAHRLVADLVQMVGAERAPAPH